MIHRSPFPDIAVPNVSLPALVLGRAEEHGDRPALVDGPSGRTFTYNQLAGAVARAASGLAARRFGRGDVLALYSPNLPEFAITFFAVTSLGGVVTIVNPQYTADELHHQLAAAGASVLVTVPPLLEVARKAADRTAVREIVVVGDAEGATPFAALLAGGVTADPAAIDPAEDLAVLPYSSGTTGLPKGVMLTHRNLVANIIQVAGMEPHVAVPVREGDVILGLLPFFHIYGMTVIMAYGLYKGTTIVTMPRFDLEQFLEVIQRYRVTCCNVVPPIVLALASHPLVDRYDLSSLRAVTSGAAPMGDDLARAAGDRIGCLVYQGFGMTELSPVSHIYPDGPDGDLGSVGPPIPNTECRLADVVTGEDVGPGATGELWVRGPQVMSGYLNDPDATAATLDDDGWLHTGDIATVDDKGYFRIVDRLKELIKYKGYQVAPAELEALLLTHPAVADAAVIGSRDEEAGEVPKAYVVPDGGLDVDELLAWVAERVAPYKRVRRVELVESIPKSPSGKVLRRELIDRDRAGRGRADRDASGDPAPQGPGHRPSAVGPAGG